MSLSCTLFLAVLGAAVADEVCPSQDAGCATGEVEDMGLLQFRTEQSGPIPECQNLSTNASAPSKCPTGTIVNPSLYCISNPSCPGITGCVEGTGCQYVDAPNTSLLEKTTPSGPIPECQNLSTNASAPSQCPTGTIVNSGLKCITNPACPGLDGCVEGTGCQYVYDAALVQGKRVRKTFAIDDVWEQMIGAVEIDQLTEKLKNATGEIAAKLQGQLDSLKEAFPAYAQIEAKFKEQWSKITAAVSMEELQSALEDAKAKGAANVEELQAKLEELKANINLDEIKASVKSFWEEHQFELPDLDELTQHLKDLGDKAKSAVQDAWNTLSSSDQVKELVDNLKEAGQDALDKVNDALGNAKDAISGWFR